MKFLRPVPFTQHSALEAHPSCGIYQYFAPFYFPVIFYFIDVLQFAYSLTKRKLHCTDLPPAFWMTVTA